MTSGISIPVESGSLSPHKESPTDENFTSLYASDNERIRTHLIAIFLFAFS
jgi:hypothetical protein